MCEQIYDPTNEELTCRLGKISGLKPGVVYSVEVLVKNFGLALNADEFSINFLPKVTKTHPEAGSVNGGTNIIITGDGFSNETTFVYIGETIYYPGVNLQVTNDTIIVVTYPSKVGSYIIQVYVNNTSAGYSGLNTFNFSSDSTPLVESVYPSTINQTSLVTLIGSNFGNTF